jgi:hypothetical protein
MSTGMKVKIATMQMGMRIRRKKHSKRIMDQRCMWRTEGRVADIDGYQCNDADADVEELVSQANDESTQNVED